MRSRFVSEFKVTSAGVLNNRWSKPQRNSGYRPGEKEKQKSLTLFFLWTDCVVIVFMYKNIHSVYRKCRLSDRWVAALSLLLWIFSLSVTPCCS